MRILLVHNKYKQSGGEDAVFRAESALLRSHGHFVNSLVFDNNDIKSFFDKIISGFRAIYNPSSARALKKMICDFKPDVIHVHNLVLIASPSILFAADQFNVPVVLTLHNYRLICPSATLFHNGKIYEKSIGNVFPIKAVTSGVYRNSIIQTAVISLMTALHNIIGTWRNKVDLYISLTKFAKNKIAHSALGLPERKLQVKSNFVEDLGEGELQRKDFFLFVGRLVEEKGVGTLLEATQLCDFKLTIIGDGPLKDLVKQYANENSNIRYLGFQDRLTIINYMKTCKALIFPSIWYEGFPVTLLEAFSTSTVVIASRLGAMEEVINDRVNGLHFEPGNKLDLAYRIIEVSEGYVDLKEISTQARLSYLEKYTPEKNYRMLMNAYSKVLALKKSIREQIPVSGITIKRKDLGHSIINSNERSNSNTMNMPCPKVTIGIPTFNGGQGIFTTLHSIWAQHYPNLEVIISDNCSTDITQELCESLAKKYPSIRYYRQKKNIGLGPNFEFVLEKATGDYFMWVADDDTLEPGILRKYVKFLSDNPDYSLVSGQIVYWSGDGTHFYERDFNLERNSPFARVIQYYSTVVYGALYYGLMPRAIAASIPLRNRVGDDWHFVATLAYIGKIKNLEYVGYNKKLGGISKNFNLYASAIGANWFSAEFPHIKIACDAFGEILFHSPIHASMPLYQRLPLAILSGLSVLINYYGREFPFIVGGKIKRAVKKICEFVSDGYRDVKQVSSDL